MLRSGQAVALMEARQFAASGAGRMIRQTARLSLAQVAAELGVNASTVFRWEVGDQVPNGDRAIAYHELMKRLSTAGALPVKPRRKVPA
jgi:DNA-binding transcriptional regulator YiaG